MIDTSTAGSSGLALEQRAWYRNHPANTISALGVALAIAIALLIIA